jgi:hypothetical protein
MVILMIASAGRRISRGNHCNINDNGNVIFVPNVDSRTGRKELVAIIKAYHPRALSNQLRAGYW